jgi:phage/plasmid-associated DNA primase
MSDFVYFTFPKIITYLNEKGEEKKKPIDMPSWKAVNKDNFHNYIHPSHLCKAVITGEMSNISVFDFDDAKEYERLLYDYPELEGYKTIQTKKGFHIYFNYNKDVLTTTNGLVSYAGVDIRNDSAIVFAPPTRYQLLDKSYAEYTFLGGEMRDIPQFLIDDLKQNNKILPKKKENIEVQKNDIIPDKTENVDSMKDIIHELANLIDMEYIDNYNDWIKIVFSFASEGNKYCELAKQISKKSLKYEEQSFNKLWSSSKPKMTIGTIYYYAKKSNSDEYMNIMVKYNSLHIDEVLKNPTQENMARCFYKLCCDDFIYTNGKVYYFNGVVWVESKFDLRRKYTNDFTNVFRKREEYYSIQMRKHDADSDEHKKYAEKKKNIHNLICQLEKNQNTKDICNDAILPYIEKNDIEFETNPYMFCFNNKVVDLEKCEFVIPFKYDYMTITTGYDFTDPTEEQIEKLDKIIKSIFPNEAERKLYLTILATGLFGKTLENFILANGAGRNGKGLLNELTEATFGHYSYTCSNAVLVNEFKDGPNQAVANMHNKRIIFYREPNESDNTRLQGSNIKDLVGGKQINARGLYQTNTNTHLRGTHIIECNKKPRMSGEVNDAIMNRLIDVPFHCSFTAKNDSEVDEKKHIYKPDTSLKEPTFQTEHRIALFLVLVEHWKEYKTNKFIEDFIPQSVRERGYKYLQNSDELFSWFEDNYEKVEDDTEIVQIKDIYEYFKGSEYYMNLSKAEKREINKSKFTEKLSTNYFLKKYYSDRDRRKTIQDKYQCSELRNVFIGYKKKDEDNE